MISYFYSDTNRTVIKKIKKKRIKTNVKRFLRVHGIGMLMLEASMIMTGGIFINCNNQSFGFSAITTGMWHCILVQQLQYCSRDISDVHCWKSCYFVHYHCHNNLEQKRSQMAHCSQMIKAVEHSKSFLRTSRTTSEEFEDFWLFHKVGRV